MSPQKRKSVSGGKVSRFAAVSIRDLGRAVGVSDVSVRKWLEDPRWPSQVPRRGPWTAAHVQAIRRWRSSTLAPDLASPESIGATAGASPAELENKKTLTHARMAVAYETAATKRLDRQIKLKQFHSVDECKAGRIRQITMVRDELLLAADDAPFDEPVKEWLRRRMISICEKFARAATAATTTPTVATTAAIGSAGDARA